MGARGGTAGAAPLHSGNTRSGWTRVKTGLQGVAVKRAGRRSAGGAAVRAARPAIAGRLVAWYRRHRRALPWRESRDPYRVWVSEIMLQQTQVERVREFFTRFVARFPDVTSLARAPQRDVLKHWEGLGYYRRARHLHAAAKQVVTEHASRFPRTAAGLRGLPGIGRYTAGAIASIAFDAREPIIEANSRRVIARLVGHAAPVGGAADEPLWTIAADLLPRRGAGLFNQALMDLGATVCTVARPLCDRCPLASACVARRTGCVAAIPAMPALRAAKTIRETALVLRHGDGVVVERRGPGEWWEGLWDFPRAARGAGRTAGDRGLGGLTYTVAHHQVSCRVVERRLPRRPTATRDRRLVALSHLRRLAMTAPGRRIAQRIASTRRPLPG
ncbi:MAG: A/G-specific adenine glycosylase [Planctomycetes bacterium]|nr:A/G-specific adenine glycosylase [Planctomycetota bacterium]